jgi:hypothetical protein
MGDLLGKRIALAAIAAAGLWFVLFALVTEAAHFVALGSF